MHGWQLTNPDILSTLPLRAHAFIVLHGLALVEAVETSAFDRGRVEEDISTVTLNKAKTLVSQLFNNTLRHVTFSSTQFS